jgi:hypothetical protein
VEARTLSPDEITVDPTIQQRANGLNFATVNEYTADYEAGHVFPPIDVFESKEGIYLADGFHRYEAQVSLGYEGLECIVHKGTRKDAILFACAANATNGMRRSNEDKQKAVRTLLAMFPKRSAAWIAEKAGVSDHMVADIKGQVRESRTSQSKGNSQPVLLDDTEDDEPAEPETVVGKDGKEYPAKKTPKEPKFPAWDKFEQYMLNLAGVKDGLLARYDRSVKSMLDSPDWNPACNEMAVHYCDECIKTLQSLRKEFKQYV